MLTASSQAISLIEASEGRHSGIYYDGAGHATAGVGHKLTSTELASAEAMADEGRPVVYSDERIDAWLKSDIRIAERAVDAHVDRPLSQHEFDALVSFAFNFGEKKFKNYTLVKMINDGADKDSLAAQWIKYVYTIDDRDKDGDKDAVIDKGLPIRRLREWLMWRGFSWAVVEAAVNANNTYVAEGRVAWGSLGGFKETITNVTDLLTESLERARNYAAFSDEPDDEDISLEQEMFGETETRVEYDYGDTTAAEVRAGTVTKEQAQKMAPKPSATNDPTPDTPLTPDDRQYQGYVAAVGGSENAITYDEFMAHRGLVAQKNRVSVPNMKAEIVAESKAIEDSKTGKSFAKEQAGKESAITGATLTGAAAAAGTLNSFSRDAASTIENTQGVVAGFTLAHFIIIGLAIGIPLVAIGLVRWHNGTKGKREGRLESTQPKL